MAGLAVLSQEALNEIMDAAVQVVETIAESLHRLAEALVPVFQSVMRVIQECFNSLLCLVATPKEWSIYQRTKKKRIREKYRKRLTMRLIAVTREGRTS